jgi:hypothetical protein
MRAFRGAWYRYIELCKEAARCDYQLMLAARMCRRTVTQPLFLRTTADDFSPTGGALP